MTQIHQVNAQQSFVLNHSALQKGKTPYSPDSIMGAAGDLTQMACEVAAILEQVSEKQTDLNTLTTSAQQRVAALSAGFQKSTTSDEADSLRMQAYQSFVTAGTSLGGGALSAFHTYGGAVKLKGQEVESLENTQKALNARSDAVEIGGQGPAPFADSITALKELREANYTVKDTTELKAKLGRLTPGNNGRQGTLEIAQTEVAERLDIAQKAQSQATNDALNKIEVSKLVVQALSQGVNGGLGIVSANYTSQKGTDQAAATLTSAAQQTLNEAAKVASPAQVQQLRLDMERQIFQAAREANSRG